MEKKETGNKGDVYGAIDGLKFKDLRRHCERIIGDWDGDESGIKEDRADTANEILHFIKAAERAYEYLDEIGGI